MALIDIYKSAVQLAHSHGIETRQTSDLVTDYDHSIAVFHKPFIFNKSTISASENKAILQKQLIDSTIESIDVREEKRANLALNAYDGLLDTSKLHYKNLVGYGFYDGLSVPLNNAIRFFGTNPVMTNYADLGNSFDSAIEAYGTAANSYTFSKTPVSFDSNDYFKLPPFPANAILATDFTSKFGQINTDYKLGVAIDDGTGFGYFREITTGVELLGSVLFLDNGTGYLDLSNDTDSYAQFTVDRLGSGNHSLMLCMPIKLESTLSTGVKLLAHSNDDAIQFQVNKTGATTFEFETLLTYTDVSTETITFRSVTLNTSSFHIVVYLIDHFNKEVYLFIDGYFIDHQPYNPAKTVVSLSSNFVLDVGGENAASNSEIKLGDIILYDIGTTEADGTETPNYWLNNKYPELISNYLAQFYEVIA